MTVKRYEFNDSVMSEFEDGQYVTYSDYQKLVAERDDFKKSAEYSAATNKKIVATNIRLSDENTELKSDAAIAEIKAQGIDEWIESRNGRWNGTTKEAEEFAADLRAGRKG